MVHCRFVAIFCMVQIGRVHLVDSAYLESTAVF